MDLPPRMCLFCLKELDEGDSDHLVYELDKKIKGMKAWDVIDKYFWFDLLNDVDADETAICEDCWWKLETFHKFYLMVEELHNKSPPDIGDEISLDEDKEDDDDDGDSYNEEEEDFEEQVVLQDNEVQSNEKVVALEIDVLDYDTNIDDDLIEQTVSLIEQSAETYENGTQSHQESNIRCENEREAVQITDTKPKKRKACKLHEKSINQPQETPDEVVPKRKRGRPPRLEDEPVIACGVCKLTFTKSQALRKHFLLHDPEGTSEEFACQTCNQVFPKLQMLRDHIENVHEEQKRAEKNLQTSICPICHDIMKFGELKSHIESVHDIQPQEKENFTCKICGKEFLNSDAFTKHAWTHLNKDLTRVQCDICSGWFKNQHTLRVHKTTHQNNELKCELCGKIKLNIQSMRSHMLLAHAKRKYQCTECHKSFRRPITLKEHMSIHTGESLYKCTYCAKPFRSNGNLYKHMKEVHTELWNIDRVLKKQK